MKSKIPHLSESQALALKKLQEVGGWVSQYDYREIKTASLNALVRKGLAVRRQKSGWSSVSEYKAVVDH
jgi:hypothetical protein